MRPYEVMVILDAGLEDDAVRAAIDRATDLIRSRGGNPGRVQLALIGKVDRHVIQNGPGLCVFSQLS